MKDQNISQQLITYSGNVKVSTYINGKLATKKHFKNSGALGLYRFFANCITGNFALATPLRPYKIKLFTYNDANSITPSRFNINEALAEGKLVPASDFIPITSAPEIFYFNSDTEVGCKIVLNFVFPYSKIFTGNIHMIGIYGTRTEAAEDLCAYYILKREQIKTQTIDEMDSGSEDDPFEWDPLTKASDEEETNKVLAVEWTMTLANKLPTTTVDTKK
jgi:hypothetical protein